MGNFFNKEIEKVKCVTCERIGDFSECYFCDRMMCVDCADCVIIDEKHNGQYICPLCKDIMNKQIFKDVNTTQL